MTVSAQPAASASIELEVQRIRGLFARQRFEEAVAAASELDAVSESDGTARDSVERDSVGRDSVAKGSGGA